MIIVNIKDGLGNQMFQYATAYALAKKINTNVICDTRYLIEKKIKPPKGYIIRNFDLDIFDIKKKKINYFALLYTMQFFNNYVLRHNITKLVDRLNFHVFMERSRKVDFRLIKNKKKLVYIDGYWQSEDYFKDYRDEILNLYNFNDLRIKKENILFNKEINLENDICLNVNTDEIIIIYFENNKWLQINHLSYKYYEFERSLDYTKILKRFDYLYADPEKQAIIQKVIL